MVAAVAGNPRDVESRRRGRFFPTAGGSGRRGSAVARGASDVDQGGCVGAGGLAEKNPLYLLLSPQVFGPVSGVGLGFRRFIGDGW